MKQILAEFEKSQIKGKRPELRAGDIVRVEQKLEEAKSAKGKGGVQKSIFEGIVISVKNPRTSRASFTARKISFGIGVEKVFPLYSPTISKIQVLKRTKVRRAKLYYLRERFGKRAKMKEKQVDKDTLKMLGWEEPEVLEKKTEEIQKEEAEKAKGEVQEMLKEEDKAVVKEDQPKTGPPRAEKIEESLPAGEKKSTEQKPEDQADKKDESK